MFSCENVSQQMAEEAGNIIQTFGGRSGIGIEGVEENQNDHKANSLW